ncbi:hypothetical protein AaE_000476, partial [Aphanomyces astaci]
PGQKGTPPPTLALRYVIAKVLLSTSATPAVQPTSSAPSFGLHERQHRSRPPSIVTSKMYTSPGGQYHARPIPAIPAKFDLSSPRQDVSSYLQPDTSSMLATISRCATSSTSIKPPGDHFTPRSQNRNHSSINLATCMESSGLDVPNKSRENSPSASTSAVEAAAVGVTALEREIERLKIESRFRQIAYDQLAAKHQTLVLRSANMCSQSTVTDCIDQVAQGTNTDVDYEREMSKLTTKITSFQLLQEVDRNLMQSMRRDHATQQSDFLTAKASLETRLQDVTLDLQTAEAGRSTTLQQVHDLSTALASSQSSKAALQNGLEQLEGECRQATHSYAACLRQQEVNAVEFNMTERLLNEERNALERNYHEMKQQHQSAITNIRDLEDLTLRLQGDLTRITVELEAQQKAMSLAQSDSSALQAKCVAMSAAYDAVSAKLVATQNELTTQSQLMTQMHQTHNADSDMVATLTRQLQELQDAKDLMQAVHERHTQACDDVTRALQAKCVAMATANDAVSETWWLK